MPKHLQLIGIDFLCAPLNDLISKSFTEISQESNKNEFFVQDMSLLSKKDFVTEMKYFNEEMYSNGYVSQGVPELA